MCDMNDMSNGYHCTLKKQHNIIKESRKYKPVTPDWCPIKKNDIMFKFEK